MIKRHNDPLSEIENKKMKEPTFAADILQFQPATVTSSPTRILALGDPNLTSMIKEDLESEGLRVDCYKTAKGLKENATGREDALIYCAPLLRSEILSIHKNLRKKSTLRSLPCFAVVPNWVNAFKEREMYKRGIRMVFEWPRERKTFAETFSSALEIDTLRVRSEDSDHSLKKAVINRMISDQGEFDPNLEISVYNGIVIVRGSVESVGAQMALSKFIKGIPGVRGVVDRSLHVGKESLPSFINIRANELIDEMDGVPEQTLMVRVKPDSQDVTIVGTAASLQTLQRAKEKLALFKGVKSVQSDVEISPRAHARDLALAKKAQRIVNKITLGSPMSTKVKVLRGEVFIKGEVASSIESSQVENAIRSLSGVKAVVNRLRIEPNQSYVANQ